MPIETDDKSHMFVYKVKSWGRLIPRLMLGAMGRMWFPVIEMETTVMKPILTVEFMSQDGVCYTSK